MDDNEVLTKEEIQVFSETFTLIGHNQISKREDLARLFRILGQNVSDVELDGMLRRAGGSINVSRFLKLIRDKLSNVGSEQTILDSLKTFDEGNSGFIAEATFRHIMSKLGSKLSEEEVDEMMTDAVQNGFVVNGKVNYPEFVGFMIHRGKKVGVIVINSNLHVCH